MTVRAGGVQRLPAALQVDDRQARVGQRRARHRLHADAVRAAVGEGARSSRGLRLAGGDRFGGRRAGRGRRRCRTSAALRSRRRASATGRPRRPRRTRAATARRRPRARRPAEAGPAHQRGATAAASAASSSMGASRPSSPSRISAAGPLAGGGDHRQAVRPGLDHHIAQRLVARGEDADVGRAVERRGVVAPAQEAHAVGDAQLPRPGPSARPPAGRSRRSTGRRRAGWPGPAG